MKIAYFIHQCPKVDDNFIRRGIAELGGGGMAIERIAPRGWDAGVSDAEVMRPAAHSRPLERHQMVADAARLNRPFDRGLSQESA